MIVYIEVDQKDIPSGSEFYNAKRRLRTGILAVKPDMEHTVMLIPKEIDKDDLTRLINGLLWFGDDGKIMGVPDMVDAIASQLSPPKK